MKRRNEPAIVPQLETQSSQGIAASRPVISPRNIVRYHIVRYISVTSSIPAVAVEVAHQDAVVRLRPGGALGIMVAVDVEGGRERGLRLDLDPVVVEVERERIDALPDRDSDY
jgi:hypothetical protein